MNPQKRAAPAGVEQAPPECSESADPNNPQCNVTDDRSKYFEALFAGIPGEVEIRPVADGRVNARQFHSDTKAAQEQIEQLSSKPGLNVFVGVATRCDGRNGTKENLRAAAALFADLDYKDTPEDEARRRLEEFPLPPSMIVHSGGGLHVYWLLSLPVDLRDRAELGRYESVLSELAKTLRGDLGAAEAARVLRPPGTINHPNGRKCQLGRVPSPVVLEFCHPERRYSIREFASYADKGPTTSSGNGIDLGLPFVPPDEPSEKIRRLIDTDELVQLRWNGDSSGLNGDDRSTLEASLALLLARRGCSALEIATALFHRPGGNKAQDRGWGSGYMVQTVASALAKSGMCSDSATPPMEPVELSDLLASLVEFLRRYVVFANSAQADACALWVAHTHLIEQLEATPYLSVSSPDKRSGKTRLLECLELLVARPWRIVSPSEAVIFRKVEKERPTLLLDEIDTIFGPKVRDKSELRGLFNAGYRKGATVSRCVGEGKNLDYKDFSVFSPKAFAGIGNLPDTLADRSIPIRLLRRTREEKVERFRLRKAKAEAAHIHAGLVEWAKRTDITCAEPPLPEELDDRAADGWEPLLAIADLAGEGWGERARRAAIRLHADPEVQEQSYGVRLLTDIQTILDERDCDKILTRVLVNALVSLDESPWGDWYSGGGFTDRTLAKLLRSYGIRPGTVRIKDEKAGKDETGKGYQRRDFEDAWKRYAPAKPPETGSQPSHRHNLVETGTYADPEPSQASLEPDSRHMNPGAIPGTSGICDGVTDRTGGGGADDAPQGEDFVAVAGSRGGRE